MAKICKQCGVKHKNSATKCAMCGTPFEDVRVSIKKRTFTLYAILALTIVVAIVLGIVFSTGPRAKVRQIMRHYKNANPSAVVDTYPSFMLESENYDIESLQRSIAANVEDVSAFMVSFSVDRPQNPNERDRKQLIDDFRYYCGDTFDESKLEDIKFVWVSFKGRVSGIWAKSTTRFVVIKYDGEWCWWPDNFNY